jgi:quercetin dioxygenase-like cupin family protein
MRFYQWNEMPEERLNPRMTRRAIHGSGLTVARLHLDQGAQVPEHHHVHEQVSLVERGALKFFVNGVEQIVRAGQSLAFAPNEPHAVEALEDTDVMDVFSPAREDWATGNDAYLRR